MLDEIRIGHWSDTEAATGTTVFIVPDGAVVAGEVRGQNSGTMNLPVLGPRGSADHADAIVLTGGSMFGLEAAAHLAVELGTRDPSCLPFIGAAVVYDLMLGARTWPPRDAAVRAYDSAVPGTQAERGTVGVGTGVIVGGALEGERNGTKGGFGHASIALDGGATVGAWAVVNSVGDVVGEDGTVLAGLHRNGRFPGAVASLVAGADGDIDWGRATTLVVVATDARLSKLQAWQLAQAGHAGIAHAIVPASSGGDGDTAFAIATGTSPTPSMLALEGAATLATAGAIRDAVRRARSLHGVPSVADLAQA